MLSLKPGDDLRNFANNAGKKGQTVVYLVYNDEIVAAFSLADLIRSESIKAVQQLQDSGIEVVMLTAQAAEDMPVSAEEAVEAAQRYLDQYLSGVQADEHADRFYGYYTLHILENDEVTGMLSVNGFSGEIFLHTWHGDFIEMSAH